MTLFLPPLLVPTLWRLEPSNRAATATDGTVGVSNLRHRANLYQAFAFETYIAAVAAVANAPDARVRLVSAQFKSYFDDILNIIDKLVVPNIASVASS